MSTAKRKEVFGCDIGNGFGYISILDDMKKHFNAVKILKPQASRTNSFETFVIGLGKKA